MATETKATQAEDFAIIETGGKQYPVSVGDVISVEILSEPLAAGDSITFDRVLLVDDGKDATIGMPYIDGAKVKGTVTHAGKAPKVNVVRFRSKSRHFKQKGHRQSQLTVKIDAIT